MINDFPQVVTIAGSDSDGSAGMQADLHAFFANQVYGMSILTSAVAGNSRGIDEVHIFPNRFIGIEFDTLAADFKIKAAKTGMLAEPDLIELVVEKLKQYDFGPLVVDPVITTKHGKQLITDAAVETMKTQLLPLATVITPNFYEAQILTDSELATEEQMLKAATQLQKMGPQTVVIKGDHRDGRQKLVRDLVKLPNGRTTWLEAPMIKTTHINGTGDTFSAAIAAQLALGTPVLEAIKLAKMQTHRAIANGIEVGHEFGPINHWAINEVPVED